MKTKEAIERVRARFDKWGLDEEDLRALQELGLAPIESKDERLRKEIISALKFANNRGIYDEHIAYLEEQKPAEWSEEDRHNLNRIAAILVEGAYVQNWWRKERLISKDEMEKLTDWLKSLRPQPHLKKLSNRRLSTLLTAIDDAEKTGSNEPTELRNLYYDFINS